MVSPSVTIAAYESQSRPSSPFHSAPQDLPSFVVSPHGVDGLALAGLRVELRAADEVEVGVVEVVCVVVVDDLDRAGVAHVHVQLLALPQAGHRRRVDLVRVVLPDAAAVVADAARMPLPFERSSRRLFSSVNAETTTSSAGWKCSSPARSTYVTPVARPLSPVSIRRTLQPRAPRSVPCEGHGEMSRVRARLRVDLAAEPGAEPAVQASRPVVAVGVGPGAREDPGRLGERVQPELGARLGEIRAERFDVERRIRVRPGARCLERVAPGWIFPRRFPAFPEAPMSYSNAS